MGHVHDMNGIGKVQFSNLVCIKTPVIKFNLNKQRPYLHFYTNITITALEQFASLTMRCFKSQINDVLNTSFVIRSQ